MNSQLIMMIATAFLLIAGIAHVIVICMPEPKEATTEAINRGRLKTAATIATAVSLVFVGVVGMLTCQ